MSDTDPFTSATRDLVRRDHLESIRLREGDDRLIVLLSRTESLSELLRCQVVSVVRTGGIVDLLEQVGQCFVIAQRQPDRQVQISQAGKASG